MDNREREKAALVLKFELRELGRQRDQFKQDAAIAEGQVDALTRHLMREGELVDHYRKALEEIVMCGTSHEAIMLARAALSDSEVGIAATRDSEGDKT